MTTRPERAENIVQILIFLIVGGMAGAASFTHVHDWTMHNAPPETGGWFGWAEDAKIEAMRDAFARSSSPEEQKKIAADIQKENYDQVIYIPLGQYVIPSAWRKSLTGVLDGPATPVFWNIDKSE